MPKADEPELLATLVAADAHLTVLAVDGDSAISWDPDRDYDALQAMVHTSVYKRARSFEVAVGERRGLLFRVDGGVGACDVYRAGANLVLIEPAMEWLEDGTENDGVVAAALRGLATEVPSPRAKSIGTLEVASGALFLIDMWSDASSGTGGECGFHARVEAGRYELYAASHARSWQRKTATSEKIHTVHIVLSAAG